MALMVGRKAQLDSCLSNLLDHNFDADSLICLQTCLKIIDNVLQKPGNPKVRMIKTTNPTIQRKITSKTGGLDILYSCGFQQHQDQQHHLILTEEKEDTEWLVSARHTLSQVAIQKLNCRPEELPKYSPPPPPRLLSNNQTGSNNSSSSPFNVYQGNRYDAQSAAVGKSLGPPKGWKSATEAQLESLEKKQAQLISKNQVALVKARQWIALKPGEATSARATTTTTTAETSSSREDSALLASHMQKQQKKQQEEANRGFTTKAMRDLEKIKKQKVYSHSLLAITFPDGCICKGQFLPTETVQTVMESMQHDLLLQQDPQSFDVYMTPPRTKLLPHQTLQELGLVPAAKVYVSWRKASSPPPSAIVGSYLKQTLFQSSHTTNGPALPSSVPVVGEDATNTAKRKKTKSERQAEMLKRMMGK